LSNKQEVFALGPRKLTEILDSFGGSHLLPDAYQILPSNLTFTSGNPVEFSKLQFIWIICRYLVCKLTNHPTDALCDAALRIAEGTCWMIH